MTFFLAILLGIIIVYVIASSQDKNKDNPYQPVVVDTDDDDDLYHRPYEPPPRQRYWDTTEYVRIPANLRLTYRDGAGETTERTVSIDGYDGSCYLRGFCNLRGEQRTFRIDRIIDAIDTDTGEMVADVPAHLRNKYESAPERKVEQIFERHGDIINALLYAGKADGQLRREERAVICTAVRIMAKDQDLPDDAINAQLNRLSVPTLQGFRLAVGRIMRANPKNLRFIYQAVQKIVATQKTVHAHESEILRYLEEKMEIAAKDQQRRP